MIEKLPLRWTITSVVIAVLVVLASTLGIFDPTVYVKESTNWATQGRGQDIGNLLAAPLLLGAMYLANKKSLRGFLAWLGVLMYLLYAYTVYAFFIHFNYLFLVYVAVLGLSFWTFLGGLLSQKQEDLEKQFKTGQKTGAGVALIVIGSLFGLLWLAELVPALIAGQVPQSLTDAGLWVNPIHVIDLAIVLPGMIVTGWLLWKNSWYGILFAAPWLIFSVLMGTSIVATMALMTILGFPNTVVPGVMVGLIVVASLITGVSYLKKAVTL